MQDRSSSATLSRRNAIKKALLAGIAFASGHSAIAGPFPASSHSDRKQLARKILADSALNDVHTMALNLLRGGLNAGTGYQTTWIRDMNTFITVALEVVPAQRFRDALLMFLKFQGSTGDIIDCYIAQAPEKIKETDRTSMLAPGFVAGKNTVESDQESSLVQAIHKYIAVTRDRSILDERIGGATVRERLSQALRYVMTERFDSAYGLVWGGTTQDWGDVQPESPRGVVLDSSSHRAFSIYGNAMLLLALNDYVDLLGSASRESAHWRSVRNALKASIRKHLWDAKRQKFIPHVYLAGSPFPKDFDENAIYYHGGTAVAIEAGLLSRQEVLQALHKMEEDVRLAHAGTIGITMYPTYPLGFFKNPQTTAPYTYQNGGDWDWFGGRMIQQLIRYDLIEEAWRNLKPMVDRTQRNGDFREWWTPDNQPGGSAQFRGSAGVLGQAIEMLQAWARQTTA